MTATGPDSLVLISLLLPAAVFLLLAVVIPLRRSGRLAALVSITGALAAFIAAVLAWRADRLLTEPARQVWTWLPAANGPMATVGVTADHTSTLMLLLVTLVAFLVQTYSLGYLSDEPKPALGRYYMYQSLFAFSMMGLVLAPNFLQLFVCWELVGLCSYLLIGFWYRKPSAARAAMKAFWTTKLGDVGLLIGIVLLWRMTGTFDFIELKNIAATNPASLVGLSVVTACIYMGAMGKSAQFPLHIWLPDAMEGPTPVSALIHAATMVTAGVYLLTRTEFLFVLTPNVLVVVAWIGAFTALMAAVLACVQSDIKRVLAFSTVSQLGYMMTAIGAGFASAGFFHLLTHGVFKALLFLGAGAVIHAVGSNDLKDMGGLAKRMPQTAIVFVIGTLSLAGIPLFGGFASKEEVLGAVWAGGFTVPFLMLLTAAFLTAFYMMRVVFLAFWGPAGDRLPESISASSTPGVDLPHGHGPAHDAPAIMTLPLWILAAIAMVVGVYFTFHHVEAEFESPVWLTPAAISVAVGGILLAWLTYQRRSINEDSLAAAFGPIRRAAHAGFWVDDAFLFVYRQGVLGFSRIVGWTDRYLVDGVVNVFSAWTVMAGEQLRRIQTGRVQDYVFGVAFGVLVVLWWLGGKP